MTLAWELLIDADMTENDWQFSTPTAHNLLRIEQINPPEIGRFALGQATAAEFEFLDIKAYPARGEQFRVTLDAVESNPRRIAIRYRYAQFPEGVTNTWQIRVYGSSVEFQPAINPSAVVITLDPRVAGAIPLEEKGIPLGVATLDESGVVPDSQLLGSGLADLVAANMEAVDNLSNQIESLPPAPTLTSLGGEPAGAETRAKAYTDQQVGGIVIPPAPTLTSLGGEPAGAETRAKAYTDQKVAAIVIPPAPTLTSLGGEPAGAETRAKAYTDQKIATAAILAQLTKGLAINCGCNHAMTDSLGRIWLADTFFTGGEAYFVPDTVGNFTVTGTTNEFICKSERSGSAFSYRIPVYTYGIYQIALRFCENYYNGVGQRVGIVKINGTVVLNNFDIFAEAQQKHKLLFKQINNLNLSSNYVLIEFTNLLVNGIEVNYTG